MIRMADNNDFRDQAVLFRQKSMTMGTLLGVYYIAKFCLFPLSLQSGVAGMAFVVLTLLVPLVAWRLVKRFQMEKVPDGMPFLTSWTFALRVFFFASLLVAVAHYIYFAFIDGGMVAQAFSDNVAVLRETSVDGVTDQLAWQTQLDTIEKTFEAVAAMTPIQLVMELLVNNLFWGSIAAIFIALFIRRPNRSRTEPSQS